MLPPTPNPTPLLCARGWAICSIADTRTRPNSESPQDLSNQAVHLNERMNASSDLKIDLLRFLIPATTEIQLFP